MIKAEVIAEENGYEVPNWLTKCKDVLTSPRTVGALTVSLLLLLCFGLWQYRESRLPVSDKAGLQSIPASGNELTVISAGSAPESQPLLNNPVAATSTGLATTSGASSPVGPAPASSLNSLQPTGSSQRSGGLTQALNQTVQSAGNVPATLLNNAGL